VLAFSNAFGCYAQYATAPEAGVAVIPASMTFSDAASIPVVYATAYHCINGVGPVCKGEKVLIHAAAGGVGLAAVQFAKMNGLIVYGTSSSPEKAKLLQDEFQVDHVINYKTHDFVTEVQRIEGTKEPCIDYVLDSIGGTYFKAELPLIKPGGRLVGYGASAVSDRSIGNTLSLVSNVFSMFTFNTIDLLLGAKSFVGVNMKRFAEERPQVVAEYLTKIVELFASGKLKTHVSKVYDWVDVNQAHKAIESRGTTGKLVLRVEADDT